MSPSSDQPLDPDRLGWPGDDEAASDSLEANHHYMPDIRLARWQDVARVQELEEELLTVLSAADDPAAKWDEISDRIAAQSSDVADDFFVALDPGVASSTLALGAIGCIPFWSCNGGAFGGSHVATQPMVRFFARAEHVPRLVGGAERANVALSQEGGRCLLVADDIASMRAFASALAADAV